MSDTLLLFACFYGATFMITQSKIFQGPRLFLARLAFFRELLSCPFCTGAHVGWVLYLAFSPMTSWSWQLGVQWLLASAAVSYLLDIFAEQLELRNSRLRDKL